MFVYVARRLTLGFFSSPLGWADVVFFLVGTAYFVTSRDNLRKYYSRVAMLLGRLLDCPELSFMRDAAVTYQGRSIQPKRAS